MFTGIVQEVGQVVAARHEEAAVELTLRAVLSSSLEIGASVAMDGVCQTVTTLSDDRFTVFAMRETLSRTTLGDLTVGAAVNLEAPLRAGDPLGGHIVQGHVDGVATISTVTARDDSTLVQFRVPDHLRQYLVPQGSVALAGVSLTLVDVSGGEASVALIPHTLEVTNLGRLEGGESVNVEVDVLAKYVERLVRPYGDSAST